jgi:hypothetical protein
MKNASAKLLRAMKYLCMSVIIAAALEVAVLCIGLWLQVRIPVAVTLGLMLGVIGYFANKLYRS